jgi:F420H(2)-dependent quinone reductase
MTKKPPALNTPIYAFLLKCTSRVDIWRYRRIVGMRNDFVNKVPVALLTTTGRKTGAKRTTALYYLREENQVILVASQAGRDTHPMWYLNLKAQPHVSVRIDDEVLELTVRDATEAERVHYWPKMLEIWPAYAHYQTWTKRVIPLVICELEANRHSRPSVKLDWWRWSQSPCWTTMSTGAVQGSGDGVIATAADLAGNGVPAGRYVRRQAPLSRRTRIREHDGAVEFPVMTPHAAYSRVAGDQPRAPRSKQ